MQDLETRFRRCIQQKVQKAQQCNADMGGKSRALKHPSLLQKTDATDHTFTSG